MSNKKELIIKEDLALVNQTVPQLMDMITEAVEHQKQVNPIYQAIHKKILSMFEKEEELKYLEAKDLIKLMELTQKAQLVPVDQLTKLIQATTTLYEHNELTKKTKTLDKLIDKFDNYNKASNIVVIEEGEIEEDNTMQDLEDIL